MMLPALPASSDLAAKHGALTLVGLAISLPLVYWTEPNTGAGATLLIVIVLLTVNALGGLAWRPRRKPPTIDNTLPDR